MMTTRSEADGDHRAQAKQEENEGNATAAAVAAIAPGSSWARLKDPRIVRVSRAFGGKDRHSKVCTVRGLRDRRVRLSVPTAIQLYDLQDRLGLNQPSKVVDWLLDVAKNEINELPPLPEIPSLGSIGQNLGQTLLPSVHYSSRYELPETTAGSNNAWQTEALFRQKSVSKEAVNSSEEKENYGAAHNAYFSSDNFFSRLDHSSSSSSSSLGLMNSSTMPYSSLMRWDPSHLSLSQSGMAAAPHQEADFPANFGLVPPSQLPTGSQQVLHGYHQGGGSSHVTQPYFPAAAEYSGGGGRQFHLLGTVTKLHPSHENDHPEKQENGFISR